MCISRAKFPAVFKHSMTRPGPPAAAVHPVRRGEAILRTVAVPVHARTVQCRTGGDPSSWPLER